MIAEKIASIKASLPEGTRLIAVSKLKPVEDIMEAYRAGQRLFGENYATNTPSGPATSSGISSATCSRSS